jgi:hypothetical protein
VSIAVALTARGPQAPNFTEMNSAEGCQNTLREGSLPMGRDPASRSRDLRGSETTAKAGGVEPGPASPGAPTELTGLMSGRRFLS